MAKATKPLKPKATKPLKPKPEAKPASVEVKVGGVIFDGKGGRYAEGELLPMSVYSHCDADALAKKGYI